MPPPKVFMPPSVRLLLHLVLFTGLTLAVFGAPGDVDLSFAPNIQGTSVSATAIQADGKILVGGYFLIARLNADGTVDASFYAYIDGAVSEIVVLPDGKILIGGTFNAVNGSPRTDFARLNSDGTLDAGFSAEAIGVTAVAVQSDGKIVIGGSFSSVSGTPRNRIARLHANGTVDPDFDPNANSVVSCLALQPDGKIIMGGLFTVVGGWARGCIARLNPDGTVDTTYDPNANNRVTTVTVQGDGKTLVGGFFTSMGPESRTYLARLEADGTPDLSFNPVLGAGGFVYTALLQANGKVLVGGEFTAINGLTRRRIARLNADGSLDSTFNPDASNTVVTIALQQDEKVIIGGGFTTVGATGRNGLARLHNDLPEIEVQQPAGVALAANAMCDFQPVPVGAAASLTFTMTNSGGADLKVLGLTIDGPDASMFSVVAHPDSPVPAGGSTTFTVRCMPTSTGTKGAFLRIASNDSDEPSIAVGLRGRGSSVLLDFGIAEGAEERSEALTAAPGATVFFGLNLTIVGSAANLVVAWAPLPVSSHAAFPLALEGISDGGVLTAANVIVNGVAIPANSVYWQLGDLPLGPLAQTLGYSVRLPNEVPFGVTYTSSASGRAAAQLIVQGPPVVLTVGQPNLGPTGGSVAVSALPANGATQVTVTFADWIDADGTLPLRYGVTVSDVGWGLPPLVPDGGSPVVQFTLPPNASGVYPFNANIKDVFGRVKTVPFSVLLVPELNLEQPAGTVLAGDASCDFGAVGVGGVKDLTFVMRNAGLSVLDVSNIVIDGADAAKFQVVSSPTAPFSVGETADLIVRFAPSRSGKHAATLRITSNDSDGPLLVVNLTATVTAAVPPAVATLAANDLTFSSATLRGSVGAKATDRQVVFEYGLTKGLGMVVTATPETVGGTATTPVAAAISGLTPHTKYFYRAKAVGATGTALGPTMSFTTRNRQPVAGPDFIQALPNGSVTIAVLANQQTLDPDGDTLAIASFTQPKTGGKVSKAGNTLVFTASATFTDAAFTYTVSDGFGGTATGSVFAISGQCLLNPEAVTYPSAGVTYPLGVSASTGWRVDEALSWVTVSPSSGNGDGIINVTLAPNAAKTVRKGDIKIGGRVHHIEQEGVVTPSIYLPPDVPPAFVGTPFAMPVFTSNPPVTYTATNLPRGLVVNNATGIISGTPTTAGTYRVTIKASNAAGVTAPSTFDLSVTPLPLEVIGQFQGLIPRDQTFTAGLGARLDFTSTSSGSVSGKLVTGTTIQSFTAALMVEIGDPYLPRFEVKLPRKGLSPLTLSVTLSGYDNALFGMLTEDWDSSAQFSGWRNTWNALSNKATVFRGLHTFGVDLGITEVGSPRGFGFGSFTVKETTGVVTLTGKLPDNSAFTTSCFVGPNGEGLIYQSLYASKGTFAGTLGISPYDDDLVWGTANWFKPPSPASARDTIFASGIGPLDVSIRGAVYVPPQPGQLVLGLESNPGDAWLGFDDGGLDEIFVVALRVVNPSPSGLTNTVVVPDNAYKLKLLVLNAATGAFSGTFVEPNATAALNRTVSFQGQIVTDEMGLRGVGFFLLPELPVPPQTLATTPKQSGRVIFQAAQ